MNRRAVIALVGLLVGLVFTPAPASAALQIPATTLVAQQHDLVGFGPARTTLFSTAYALEWTLNSGVSTALAEHEATELNGRGFQEGVSMYFIGRKEGRGHREAASATAVFASSAGAQQELASAVSTFLKEEANDPRFHRGTVQAIPGSIELGKRDKSGGFDNVFFSTGRCFFVIGDAIHEPSLAGQFRHPVRTAAATVYAQAKQACA